MSGTRRIALGLIVLVYASLALMGCGDEGGGTAGGEAGGAAGGSDSGVIETGGFPGIGGVSATGGTGNVGGDGGAMGGVAGAGNGSATGGTGGATGGTGGATGGTGGSGGTPVVATTLLNMPGTFLTYPMSQDAGVHNVRYSFNGSGINYRRLTVDFDVWVNAWDPNTQQRVHCLMWLNRGQDWADMLGYLNAVSVGKMRFAVNSGIDKSADVGPLTTPGAWYHVSYWFDTEPGAQTVGYRIYKSTAAGKLGAVYNTGKSFAHTLTALKLSAAFVELGFQKSAEGPEAYTPGWKWANLKIVGFH